MQSKDPNPPTLIVAQQGILTRLAISKSVQPFSVLDDESLPVPKHRGDVMRSEEWLPSARRSHQHRFLAAKILGVVGDFQSPMHNDDARFQEQFDGMAKQKDDGQFAPKHSLRIIGFYEFVGGCFECFSDSAEAIIGMSLEWS